MGSEKESALKPSLIPLFKKQKFLVDMTEDEFRDRVVRPFYILRGLEHGKDLCGPDEDGKDCYFFGKDVIRGKILYAVQTKRGDLKMSRIAKDNVVSAATQMKTALSTTVRRLHPPVLPAAAWRGCPGRKPRS